MSSLSGKRLSSSRLNSAFSKRISVRQWPSRYSSFGNRRFPLEGAGKVGDERFPTNQLSVETPLNDSRAPAYWERVSQSDLGDNAQASASVEFRDAYYAQLSKRVDDWMEKVNNLSLRDVNRFQFRRHRPSEPGLPVQKAGRKCLLHLRKEVWKAKLAWRNSSWFLSGAPSKAIGSVLRKFVPPLQNRESARKGVSDIPSSSRQEFQILPQAIVGPKKIRVEVK